MYRVSNLDLNARSPVVLRRNKISRRKCTKHDAAQNWPDITESRRDPSSVFCFFLLRCCMQTVLKDRFTALLFWNLAWTKCKWNPATWNEHPQNKSHLTTPKIKRLSSVLSFKEKTVMNCSIPTIHWPFVSNLLISVVRKEHNRPNMYSFTQITWYLTVTACTADHLVARSVLSSGDKMVRQKKKKKRSPGDKNGLVAYIS